MATVPFSTQRADYWLQLGSHGGKNRNAPFPALDALVLEAIPQERLLDMESPQMKAPIVAAMTEEIPIYAVDNAASYSREKMSEFPIPLAAGILAGSMAEPSIGAILTTVALTNLPPMAWVGNARMDTVTDIYGMYTAATQGIFVFREAIAARKLEESVVPELEGKLGRRPRIGLVYGAAHSGLKHHLRHARVRNATLWNWRNFNFGRWAGADRDTLDHITVFEPPSYRARTYASGLFG